MKRILLLFLFVVAAQIGRGQNAIVDSLMKVIESPHFDSVHVNACNDLFVELEYVDPNHAKQLLDEAIRLSKKNGYLKGLSASYTNLAYLSEDKGDFPGALENHKQALNIREQLRDAKAIAESRSAIGLIYYYQGNYPEALKVLFSALRE